MKTKTIVNITLGLAFVLTGYKLQAQQQVQFTQYMYNTMSVNPAYAGTSNRLEAQFIHRSQWVGLAGAPSTQNLGVQGIVKNLVGLGLNITNDKIGPARELYINGNVAVNLPITSNVRISLGLNGGIDVLSVDWSKGQYKDGFDQTMSNNINNRVRPLIGAGTYLYSDKWYFGLSSPSFIQKDTYGREDEAMINSNIHWYIIGGYVFQLTDQLKLKPAVLGKIVKGAPVTVDLSANLMIRDMYTVGVGYRYKDAISLLLGVTLKKSYFIGYSYDATLTKLRGYGSGSHDIIFKYSLFTKEQGARSPRFF